MDDAIWGIAGLIIAAFILLYGWKKAPEMAKNLGKIPAYFKAGRLEAEKELKEITGSGDTPH